MPARSANHGISRLEGRELCAGQQDNLQLRAQEDTARIPSQSDTPRTGLGRVISPSNRRDCSFHQNPNHEARSQRKRQGLHA